MFTKTMKFDEAVLSILRDSVTWSDDGLQCTIAPLSRDEYVKVNKALEAMGGKWNRSAKAHLFPSDPRPSVDGLIQSGSLDVIVDSFFETVPDVIDKMIDLHTPFGRFLEPEAGEGAILDYVKHYYGDEITEYFAVEIDLKRCGILSDKGYFYICGDFLELIPSAKGFDTIFMNPPFEKCQDIDHVRHAYNFLSNHGVLVAVMSAGVTFRSDKKTTDFRTWLNNVGGEIYDLPEKSFHTSGTDVNACLVCVRK